MYSKIVMATTVACLTIAQPAAAEKQLGAHVHGVGAINLAQEGNQLYIELKMPAHDALGFETITTDAQKATLAETLKTLESEELWVIPAKAQCQMNEVHAGTGGEHETHDGHDHEHEEHNAKHDEHDHEHEEHHAKHDEHDHEHADNHKEGSKHLDISATYIFTCKEPQQLKTIGTRLFERFQRSESVNIQGLTDKGAINATLSRQKPEVKL